MILVVMCLVFCILALHHLVGLITHAREEGRLDTAKRLEPRVAHLVAENHRLFEQYLEAKLSFDQAVEELERRGL